MSNQTTKTQDRNMITEKEHLYIKDMLSWELLAMKKCKDAATQCNDPQFAQLINGIGLKHEQNYLNILSKLPQ
jgi:predicted metal-dependent phosphoesterase TrpH